MSKPIETYADLVRLCKTTGLWYVGSFMMEFLDHRDEWSDPEKKKKFIKYMFEEYGAGDNDISGTTTRVNAMIRIVESHKVKEALQIVLDANDKKLDCAESKINAQLCLDLIEKGEIKY